MYGVQSETPSGSADAGDELSVLGVGEESAATYRALVAVADADAAEIAKHTGLAEEEVAASFEDLREHGLAVELAPDGPGRKRLRATPPSLALTPLLAARRSQLTTAEGVIAKLSAAYQASRPHASSSPIEVVHGREVIAQRFAQVQLSATRLIEAFQPFYGGSPIVPVEDNPAEKEAIRRGVRFVIIIERAWFDRPDAGALAGVALAAGEELHVIDSLPLQMILVDRRIAMVPVAPAGQASEPAAALIHDPGLVEAFRALFVSYRERSWAITSGKVTPVQLADAARGTDSSAAQPDEVDRSILALLNAGFTDVNIARQIGIAPRSVQRRMHRLMGLAEARSRFQLGSHAVRAGWLPDPAD